MTEERPPADQITEALRQIANLDIDRDLVRSHELGTLNFSDHRELFESVVNFSSKHAELPWKDIPKKAQENILGQLNSLISTLGNVREFSLTNLGGNPSEERERIVTSIQSYYDQFGQQIIPYIGYLSWNSISLDIYRDELNEVVRSTRDSAQQQLDEIVDATERAKQALQVIRDAAAEQGVSQEATTFREAANRYATSAKRWLGAAIGAAALTIGVGFAIVLLWGLDGQISDAGILQIVLAKAAVLAVLVYGTVTAVRLYRSNAHLAAVNRHREDALRTFRSFVEGTTSDDTKDQVLLAAARAAFGQVPTGLVGDKGDGASILEVLGGIGGNLTRRS